MMEELVKILTDHAVRYPAMEPTDAVKLIYQNEFGGGHLIREEARCLEYLRREYEQTLHDPDAARWEDLGNGILRVNLAALPREELDRLSQVFLQSAAAHPGQMRRFLKKLELLRQMTQSGTFGFSTEELDAYLASYAQAGYPAVSHSEAYRAAYHPAYRIVVKTLWNAVP